MKNDCSVQNPVDRLKKFRVIGEPEQMLFFDEIIRYQKRHSLGDMDGVAGGIFPEAERIAAGSFKIQDNPASLQISVIIASAHLAWRIQVASLLDVALEQAVVVSSFQRVQEVSPFLFLILDASQETDRVDLCFPVE